MKRWTSLFAAVILTAVTAVQPMALSSLREQEAREGSQTAEITAAEQQPSAETAEKSEAAEAAAEAEETAHTAEPEDTGAEPVKEATAAANVSTEQALLDNAALGDPQAPSSAALDGVVTAVMDEIVSDDMGTYEKVKACYDYVTGNVAYGNHMAYMSTPIGSGTCWDVYQSYGEVEGFGSVALTAGKGMCNAYASAFILMVRRLGLDARLVKGYTLGGGGGYAYHEWAEMDIGGATYVFDPQLEQDLIKSGLPAYSVFCKSYAALGRRYQK